MPTEYNELHRKVSSFSKLYILAIMRKYIYCFLTITMRSSPPSQLHRYHTLPPVYMHLLLLLVYALVSLIFINLVLIFRTTPHILPEMALATASGGERHTVFRSTPPLLGKGTYVRPLTLERRRREGEC